MFKTIQFCALTVFVLLLATACASKSTSNPTSQQNRVSICQHLKQEIIMNSVGDAPGYMRNNPAQCAQLYKDYAQHNCDNVLRISSKNVTASPVDSATTHL